MAISVFIFSHSTFDVGRSMFDVHLFSVNLPRPLAKNALAIIIDDLTPDNGHHYRNFANVLGIDH